MRILLVAISVLCLPWLPSSAQTQPNNPTQQRASEISKKQLTASLNKLDLQLKTFHKRLETIEIELAAKNKSCSVFQNALEKTKLFSAKPEDCSEVLKNSPQARSGVYTVYTGLKRVATRVYCDMDTLRGGWTSILRRYDGSVDFNRPWSEVKSQIGNLNAEHWLGLDAIYRITNEGPGNYELLVELEDEKFSQYARYSSFWIEDEPHKYRLHVSGYNPRSTAGDSLSRHNSMGFSTMDYDNDNDSGRNCAQLWKGAWWYADCFDSNLLGAYLYTPQNHGSTPNHYGQGINWAAFTGLYTRHKRSLKKASLKIRSTDV